VEVDIFFFFNTEMVISRLQQGNGDFLLSQRKERRRDFLVNFFGKSPTASTSLLSLSWRSHRLSFPDVTLFRFFLSTICGTSSFLRRLRSCEEGRALRNVVRRNEVQKKKCVVVETFVRSCVGTCEEICISSTMQDRLCRESYVGSRFFEPCRYDARAQGFFT